MQLPKMHRAGWVKKIKDICHKFHNFQSTVVGYFENVKIKMDIYIRNIIYFEKI